MAKYVIEGGNKLNGKIEAESAKNAVLPLLAGSILTEEKIYVKKCPKITDVANMLCILKELGCKIYEHGNDVEIDSSSVNNYEIPDRLTREIRSSIFMLGPLIARFHRAVVSYPGGCDIGVRPIDLHLDALRKTGVEISEEEGKIICSADTISGATIYLDFPSVGATENVMMAGVLAEGETIIHNPAREPEIIDLQNFLNKMGAKITGAGSDVIRILGVKKLRSAEHKPIADRIEVGTFLIATAINGGEVEIFGANCKKISALIDKLSDNTCKITSFNDIIHITSKGTPKAVKLQTSPYPGFPTDLQAPILSLACVGRGVSIITENIFETRFNQVSELIKMGADITIKDRTAVIKGKKNLHGAEVRAKELRGGAGLVLAGLKADGITYVNDVYHIERGYVKFDEKLSSLGAKIKRE